MNDSVSRRTFIGSTAAAVAAGSVSLTSAGQTDRLARHDGPDDGVLGQGRARQGTEPERVGTAANLISFFSIYRIGGTCPVAERSSGSSRA